MDYNLHNRAEFDNNHIQYIIHANPYAEIAHPLPIQAGWTYWLSKITWDPAKPLTGPKLVGGEILKPIAPGDRHIKCPTPQPFGPGTTFNFLNANQGAPNEIVILLEGTMVKPRPGAASISLKEMMGYILSGNKGELLLDEAAMDSLDVFMKQQGIRNFRESGPLLTAIGQLPECLQAPMLAQAGMLGPKNLLMFENPALPALVDSQDQMLSKFIADLAQIDDLPWTPSQLKKIAKHMIDLDWTRDKSN